jgi:hypothetical protein
VPSDRAEELEVEGERYEAEERRDRQVMEVLQELRVAITGAQILFGFLLTVPFAQRWGDTDDFQRTLFLVTLLAVALATGFFIAPTSVHRLRFHQRDRSFLVGYANTMAIVGLACLSVAMTAALLLITDVVFSRTTAVVAAAVLATVLLVTWFAVPVGRYLRDR